MLSHLIRTLMVFCLAITGQVAQAAHDGDINLDAKVDIVDLLWGQQALTGTRSLSALQQLHGDVAPLQADLPNPDGVFDLGDLLVIQRMVLNGLVFAYPGNQFNIGDSIGEGEAADGTIGEAHHDNVWSTGYNSGDSVNAFNERFESAAPVAYYENTSARDAVFNHAVSGAKMDDFVTQAQEIVADTAQTPSGKAGMVTVFLGNNDVCASSIAAMTDPNQFEADYRAGLDVLAASATTRQAQIHVTGIPAIYWLWNAKRGVFWCRAFAWPFVPCENLLDNPSDDCANSASREDPDTVYPGDGSNCQRRKEFHRLIRDVYNPILRDVTAEYRTAGTLPNARFTDIFQVRFESGHINGGDCFHPSESGHAMLADEQWCRTHWGANNDPACVN